MSFVLKITNGATFFRLFLKILPLCALGILPALQAADLARGDFFEIARVVTRKPNGTQLVMRNILAHHVSTEFGKSYFQTNDPGRIAAIIDAVVTAPSFHDFSRSTTAGTAPKLMIIKDFTKDEAVALMGQEFIGIHVRPDMSAIPSNKSYALLWHC